MEEVRRKAPKQAAVVPARQERLSRALTAALAAVVAASLSLSALASEAPAQVNADDATEGMSSGPDGEIVEVRTCDGGTAQITQRESELLALHNEARQAQDLDYLCLNPTLSETAEAHATDMIERGYFSHEDRDRGNPIDRAKAAGYPSDYVGENIAYTRDENASASDTLAAWLDSEGHRENIQNGEYLEAGFGSVSGTDEGIEAAEGYEERTVDVANFGKRDDQEGGRDGESHAYPEVLSGASPESRTDGAVDENAASEPPTEASSPKTGASEGDTSSGDQYAPEDTPEGQDPGGGSTQDDSTEGSPTGASSEAGSPGEGSQDGQSVVQISENGKTQTLKGDEAQAKICEQFAETREEVISSLRENAQGDDPGSAVRTQIADDFEESFLNPSSCGEQGGGQSNTPGEDPADGSTEGGSTEDAPEENPADEGVPEDDPESATDGGEATEGGTAGDGSEESGSAEQEPEVIVTPEE